MSEIAIVLDEAERLNVVPLWACVHVWLRRAPVNGSPPAGKIEVRPGGDSGTATG